MRVIILRWSVGAYCCLLGAMMLVVPHQFARANYIALVPHLWWLGPVFIVAGGSLLAVAMFEPGRKLAVAAHLPAGLVLLMVARGFALNDTWIRAIDSGLLGAGTILAPLLPSSVDRGTRALARDLLAVLIGMSAFSTGVAIFAVPAQFNAAIYDAIRVQLPWYGVAFVVTGLGLIYLQVRPHLPSGLAWAVYLSASTTLLSFMARTVAPLGSWTGVLYYGGFGALLAISPWLSPILERIKPASLRVRLAVVLTVAVTTPMIAAVAIVTDRAERSATEQALALQETIASTLAHDISRYVTFHRAAALSLAKSISVSQMSPPQQDQLLRTLGEQFPDVSEFSTYDVAGNSVARSDSRPPEYMGRSPLLEGVRRTGDAVLIVDQPTRSGRLVFEIAAPLLGQETGAGILVLQLETARLELDFDQAGTKIGGRAYLVDSRGRILVQTDTAGGVPVLRVSNAPPVAAFRSDKAIEGAIRYAGRSGDQLAGYARVPGVGWGVVVERPLAVALAGTHAGRNIAFLILLLLMAGAAVAGPLAATALVRPLEALAREARRLGEDDTPGSLPQSRIAEIRDLSRTFGEMSARLAARTRERAAAEEELRRRNAYLSALHETALGLMNRLDLMDLLGALMARAAQLVDAPDGVIYLVDESGDALEAKVALGSDQTSHTSRIERGEGLAGRVWVSGDPLVIDDYDTWPGRLNRPLGLYHGVVGIPLKSGDQVAGVMILRYREAGRMFARDSVDVLERFGQLAALAIDNARLHGTLREREARIRSIMDSTGDGLIFVGRDGLIKSLNDRATHLLPPGAVWAQGRDFVQELMESRISAAERHAVVATLEALLAGREPTGRGDLEVPGSHVLEWEAQPAKGDTGATVGLTFTVHDVTEAREVSRMKSDFVSFVTHQLRTPLSGIKWMLELAAGTQDAGEIQDYVQDAREANERLVTLVNDLLDISRLESGRLVVSPEETHLDKMTQDVLDELTPLIKEKGHRFSVSGTDGIPSIVADPQLLRQVIMNLISNAIKYTPPPGEITLRMRPENGSVEWAIQDNGIGIPRDALPRMFEKFYRADNVHKIETEGTGLGLYLVRLIVEKFGGRIWVESEEGKGSTFSFTVPRAGEEQTWKPPANGS